MNENDAIQAEIEREREELEKSKITPPVISHAPVSAAKYVWIIGVLLIDALTAWVIWQVSGYWQYAAIWIFAGAGGLVYSEWLKERIGNNVHQQKIGDDGVIVSALAVLVMALGVGAVYVMGIPKAQWMNAVMELAAVGLFFFHLYQSYQYYQKDDHIAAMNDEARSEERARWEIEQAHRSARKVEAKKRKNRVVEGYERQHGGAFTAAYRQKTGNENQGQARPQNNPVMAQDTKREELNPTPGRER